MRPGHEARGRPGYAHRQFPQRSAPTMIHQLLHSYMILNTEIRINNISCAYIPSFGSFLTTVLGMAR